MQNQKNSDLKAQHGVIVYKSVAIKLAYTNLGSN